MVRPDEETAERIDIVFTEDCLLHVVGNESVMREQVLHLLQLLEQYPALRIRIVGLRTPNNPANGGGLVTLAFDTSEPITFVSSIFGAPIYYDQPSHTELMRARFEQVADLAWSPRDTRTALIDYLSRSS